MSAPVDPSARELVRAALDVIGAEVPADDDAPLAIDSFSIVLLVEELEAKLGRRIPAREVRRERFASIASVAVLVASLTDGVA